MPAQPEEPADQTEAFLRAAESYWKSRNSSMTAVRRILCRKLAGASEALDAETLLREARAEDRLISLSTVYRTLASLSEGGLLTEVEGRSGKMNYHPAPTNRQATSHIVCEDCGHVTPIENPCLTLREGASAQQRGFTPSKITLRMEARCDRLKKDGACEHHGDAETAADGGD